jgi:site-specific DNA recombinase
MRVAVYARVSTTRQAQAQTIEQQLDRLRAVVAEHGWTLDEQHVYRDDGYSGASLGRPGLDRLRDQAALAELDLVLVTAPDRLARNYVHQVLLIDELGRHGCQVEFLDRPMSQDPHDQLLLQIRGAVAEYERTLIAERMRRGRQAKLRAGTLLPWTTPPFGYRLDPERPRDAAGVRVERAEAVLVAQLFDWYLEPQATVYRLAKRLTDLGVPTPTGKPRWNAASVRGILRNPAYAGRAQTNRTRVVPAQRRKSALLPVGPGEGHTPRPAEEWIAVPVPQIVSEETFAQVQAKLDTNQQTAARNTRHEYLLRALVSCGVCRLACTMRRTQAGYRYYLCRGRTDALRVAQGQRCTARYTPAEQLDQLVWSDLCALLCDPAQVAHALERARGGAWLPQELQARQATIHQALGQLERQQQRLLDAYLAEVVGLAELERKRQELDRRRATLAAQQHQLDAVAEQRLELRTVAGGIEAFCQTVRAGLATATFAQRRLLVELLIDRVVVTDGEVEIRYVLPTSPDGPHLPYCQLRKDHLHPPAQPSQTDQLHQWGGPGQAREPVLGRLGLPAWPFGQQPAHRQLAAVCSCQPPWGDPGRTHPQAQEPAALQPLAATPPGQLDAGLLPRGQDQLGERGRLVAVARPGTAATSLMGCDAGADLLGVGAGVRPDLHHVGHLAGVQPATEAADLPVARVGQQHRRRQLPAGQLVQHVQHQLPLGPVVDLLGQVAGGTPGGHGVLVPALREEPPPVQRAGGVLGHRVDRHAQLAVGGLAQRARVLALHPHRTRAVLGEAGVVHHPRGRGKRRAQHLSQPPADRPPVPRAGGDEVVQRLVVRLAQALGHRLDRLAPTLQHQPAQVALPPGALIGPWQRREDVLGEGFQASTDRGQLGWCEATHRLLPCAWTGRDGFLTPYPSTTDLTESY